MDQKTNDILNHQLISERYFFPQKAELPQAVMVPVAGASLGCWRSGPPSDKPVLLHFQTRHAAA